MTTKRDKLRVLHRNMGSNNEYWSVVRNNSYKDMARCEKEKDANLIAETINLMVKVKDMLFVMELASTYGSFDSMRKNVLALFDEVDALG